jgi:hypothetical protein
MHDITGGNRLGADSARGLKCARRHLAHGEYHSMFSACKATVFACKQRLDGLKHASVPAFCIRQKAYSVATHMPMLRNQFHVLKDVRWKCGELGSHCSTPVSIFFIFLLFFQHTPARIHAMACTAREQTVQFKNRLTHVMV